MSSPRVSGRLADRCVDNEPLRVRFVETEVIAPATSSIRNVQVDPMLVEHIYGSSHIRI